MTDTDELDDYLEKSLSAGRMGKAVEYLVAAACILASRGELNEATSLVDDEGVDLVFNRRGSSATLAVQVKARTSDSKGCGLGPSSRSCVRRPSGPAVSSTCCSSLWKSPKRGCWRRG